MRICAGKQHTNGSTVSYLEWKVADARAADANGCNARMYGNSDLLSGMSSTVQQPNATTNQTWCTMFTAQLKQESDAEALGKIVARLHQWLHGMQPGHQLGITALA